MNKNWYAVHTKPLCEKKVASMLMKKRIESYCPLNCTVSRGADQKRLNFTPLFTSFVFVHIEDAELSKVKEIDGVINFLFWHGLPAVIDDREIETIKLFLKEFRNLKLEKTFVDKSGSVRVVNEPVVNELGSSITLKTNMKATLPSLGYMLIAEGQKSNVEILNTSTVHQQLSFN